MQCEIVEMSESRLFKTLILFPRPLQSRFSASETSDFVEMGSGSDVLQSGFY